MLTEWRPPYLDALIGTIVISVLGAGILRKRVFAPMAEATRLRDEAEARLTGLLNISPDCVGVLDVTGAFRQLNQPAAEIFGFETPEAFLDSGKVLSDFVAEQDHPRLQEIRRRLESGEKKLHGVKLSLMRPNGSVVETELSVAALLAKGGESGSFVVSLRDQTQRIRAEKRQREIESAMRQAQKLESLGLLASGIAHDFNNLLSVVIGSADLALAAAADQPKIAENIRQTLRGAKHASVLTRELLVYSGKAKQMIGPVNLSTLVRDIGGLLDVAIPSGVTLETHLAAGLPTFEGDPAQMQQVVLNLITNAAEACGESAGKVRLVTQVERLGPDFGIDIGSGERVPEGQYLSLSVYDDGEGISPERLHQIFDPFFTTKLSGRGLGLSAVLGIVRDHHGYTLVESEQGKGTRFSVLIPLAEEGFERGPDEELRRIEAGSQNTLGRRSTAT